MSVAPEAAAGLAEEAKVFAALSGRFDPKTALPAAAKDDPKLLVEVATLLAAGCDTNPDHSSDWLLRTSERRHILARLATEGQLGEAISQRRSVAADPETDDLLLALEGAGSFAPEQIRAEVENMPSEQRLERIVVALDRAGEAAPSAALLDRVRSALGQIRREARRAALRQRGFFGREAEKEQLKAWLEAPEPQPPVRCAFITGLPGIGKSALLEEMVILAHDVTDGITVRLDFDRAGLSILDLQGLTMEVARQVADRAGPSGQELLAARLEAASVTGAEESSLGSRQSLFPEALAQAIGKAVHQRGRPVTLVLDTLEVLRARGERHPPALFDWLDKLVQCGLQPLHVIAAGRGDALDTSRERVAEPIELSGLDDRASGQLLDRLQVPTSERAPILKIADGNPLVVRLAAHIAKKFGAGNLPRGKLDREVSAAFLYRFLLSRIEDPLLRRLAHPGLIVRRVSAALLHEVIAPELGAELGAAEAKRVFEELASQHWLVTRDPMDDDFVIHRSDMRLVLLQLLYRDEPASCARINKAAVAWFGRRSDRASALDAAYHRLQLMRTRAAAPPIDSDLLHQFGEQLIAELPEAAQNLVARGRGERSNLFRGLRDREASEQAFLGELMNLIDRQDWAEGQYIVDEAGKAGGFDPRSRSADAVRAFWWGAGRWSDARRLLGERDVLGAGDEDLGGLPPLLADARLEMRAELDYRRLRTAVASFGFERLENMLRAETTRPLSRQGALAFWFEARSEPPSMRNLRAKELNPAEAAIGLWTGEEPSYWTQAALIARDRLTTRGGVRMWQDPEINPSARGVSPMGVSPASAPQLIASSSPHLPFVLNLVTQQGYDWLLQAAKTADERLGALGGFLFAERLAPLPANGLAGIAGLGLLAEWLDAVGFIRRDPNLRTIGRAAERWRRTVGGRWSYGRPPRRWSRFGKIDRILECRLQWVADSVTREATGLDRPVDRAMAALEAWWPDPDGEPLLKMLERRLAGVLRRAATAATPHECADVLLQWKVPAAFVPSLAILIGEGAIELGEKDER